MVLQPFRVKTSFMHLVAPFHILQRSALILVCLSSFVYGYQKEATTTTTTTTTTTATTTITSHYTCTNCSRAGSGAWGCPHCEDMGYDLYDCINCEFGDDGNVDWYCGACMV